MCSSGPRTTGQLTIDRSYDVLGNKSQFTHIMKIRFAGTTPLFGANARLVHMQNRHRLLPYLLALTYLLTYLILQNCMFLKAMHTWTTDDCQCTCSHLPCNLWTVVAAFSFAAQGIGSGRVTSCTRRWEHYCIFCLILIAIIIIRCTSCMHHVNFWQLNNKRNSVFVFSREWINFIKYG